MIFNFIKLNDLLIIAAVILLLIFYCINNFFKISGFVIYLFSLVIFVLSLFLKSIYIEFFALSILFVFIINFCYYIFIKYYFKKRKLEIQSINHELLYPLKENVLHININYLPISYPLIFFNLNFNLLNFKNEKMESLSALVNVEGKSGFFINLFFKQHGEFIVHDALFVINDIFGFTKFEIEIDITGKINVSPYFTEAVKLFMNLDKGGEEILQSLTKVNSTDFFENRKYYPGDDTRKINWKLFAHSKELHVREVEKIPPKVGQLTILFAPYSDNLLEYEYISSLFITTIYYLLEFGYEIKIISPVKHEKQIIDKNRKKELDFIINNSKSPINIDSKNALSNLIIFSSFFEFKKIIQSNNLKNSFSVISFYESVEEINNYKKILKLILKVNNYDNLFKEIYYAKNNYREKKIREMELENVRQFSSQNNITTDVYRINEINQI